MNTVVITVDDSRLKDLRRTSLMKDFSLFSAAIDSDNGKMMMHVLPSPLGQILPNGPGGPVARIHHDLQSLHFALVRRGRSFWLAFIDQTALESRTCETCKTCLSSGTSSDRQRNPDEGVEGAESVVWSSTLEV